MRKLILNWSSLIKFTYFTDVNTRRQKEYKINPIIKLNTHYFQGIQTIFLASQNRFVFKIGKVTMQAYVFDNQQNRYQSKMLTFDLDSTR